MSRIRIVGYKQSNENGNKEVTVAYELPWILSFLSNKFVRYKTYERFSICWYDKETDLYYKNARKDGLNLALSKYIAKKQKDNI